MEDWSYVYACPECNTLVRAMGEIEVVCGSCSVPMVRQRVYVCPECQTEIYSNDNVDVLCRSCMKKMEMQE